MKRCLVVDDSKTIRTAARRIASELGFLVREADNGEAALEECRRAKPDIVLLDWNMPVMDGPQFLAALPTAVGGERPVIILCTTQSNVDHIVQMLAAGADEYIMKPFDAEILEAKFRQVGLLA